jgi:predicted esterase
MMREHHFPVGRTARFYTLGDTQRGPSEVWFVLHGYGQLASRFLHHFEVLNDGRRLIVAPEALSRFYLDQATASHTHSSVGASWMTREDRLSEIDDYIEYLDALADQIRRDVGGKLPRVVALGFSQGVATVCRWVTKGQVVTDRLIMWGGLVPHDLDLETLKAPPAASARRENGSGPEITIVVGSDDGLVPAASVAEQAERLARASISARTVSFAGGHRLDDETLIALAGAPAVVP